MFDLISLMKILFVAAFLLLLLMLPWGRAWRMLVRTTRNVTFGPEAAWFVDWRAFGTEARRDNFDGRSTESKLVNVRTIGIVAI